MIDKQITENHINRMRIESAYPISILVENISLENEPRNKIKKLIELSEFTIKLMVIYGISIAKKNKISIDLMNDVLKILERPTFGIWENALTLINKIIFDE